MNEPLKVFTAFSGYDSLCMALDKLNINYELVGWSEIDKYAIKAHNIIYPLYEDRNFGDIALIDWAAVPHFDLFTYSFPCLDISTAGLQRGLAEGSNTRSSLLWECKKAISIVKPKYLVMENVKAITFKKFLPYLNEWEAYLESNGYKNYSAVLNAKNYGVPLNRERFFMVSVLDGTSFDFPEPFDLKLRIKDVLEPTVDSKYYLSPLIQERFTLIEGKDNIIGTTKPSFRTIGQRDLVYNVDGVMGALVATDYKQPKQILVNESYLLVPQATKKGYVEVCEGGIFDGSYPNSKTRRGRALDGGNVSPTLTASGEPFNLFEGVVSNKASIRKITPTECFRLMGVSEDNINKLITSKISNTQLYKMAGNSIVVDVLYYIFKALLK